MEGELLAAVALLEDVTAGDVGRQQVRRELDAPELERQQPRERLDEIGLAEAGQAFEQDVAPREQRGDHFVDRLFLAEDDAPEPVDEPRDFRVPLGHATRSQERRRFASGHGPHFWKYFLTAL